MWKIANKKQNNIMMSNSNFDYFKSKKLLEFWTTLIKTLIAIYRSWGLDRHKEEGNSGEAIEGFSSVHALHT